MTHSFPTLRSSDLFAIMRTTSIDALPTSVGKSGGAIATEQGRQPSGQVATDHVAILGESRPARHQMRQCCRPAGTAALYRVLQIEEAEIIFPALEIGRASCRDRVCQYVYIS